METSINLFADRRCRLQFFCLRYNSISHQEYVVSVRTLSIFTSVWQNSSKLKVVPFYHKHASTAILNSQLRIFGLWSTADRSARPVGSFASSAKMFACENSRLTSGVFKPPERLSLSLSLLGTPDVRRLLSQARVEKWVPPRERACQV